ncbi:UNVERIFIED_CONTAM: hypothetical protein BEN50_19880 [Euhalothece sp. KZN 001]
MYSFPSLSNFKPIILIIDRKGSSRVIQFPSDGLRESSVFSIETLFPSETAKIIQELIIETLSKQKPVPFSIALTFAGEKQQYFGSGFPLSLASVLFIAQPRHHFTGELTQRAIELFPLPALIYEPKTLKIVAVNQVAIEEYCYSQKEFLEIPLSELYPSHNLPPFLQQVSELTRGEWQNYRKDGKLIYVAITAHPIPKVGENQVLLIKQNITEYQYIKTALGKKELIAMFPPSGILGFNSQWNYKFAVGNAIRQLTEKTMSEGEETIEGKNFLQVFSSELRASLAPIQANVLSGKYETCHLRHNQANYHLKGYPLTDENGIITGGFIFLKNLTPSQQLQALLDQHAFYDAATNLPNKTWFLEKIRIQINTAIHGKLGVIVLRLERYCVVKYGLGYELAEKLMVAVAQRLKKVLQLNSEFARIGDATIAISLVNFSQKEDLEKIAQYIHAELSLALNVEGQELFCPVSIGVAIYDQNSESEKLLREPSALLHAADTAMNAARGDAISPCVIFHPNLHHRSATRIQLETELRRALKLRQLDVFYQPTVNLAEGKLAGFEALVRWQHPENGIVSPAKFVPLAEELGLIGFIDWWVLAEACEKLAIWQEMIPQGESLSMNVNLSEDMINQVGILERLDKIIKRTGINPNCLKLEVTEGIILEGKTATTGIIKQLQALGVLLSIDDFGTGYSSLQRLHQLPINTLKIDKSFTKRMLKDSQILQIVKTIITLAHNLNMDVIAEGIEEVKQWEILRELNCEYGQGFLFSKPLPEDGIGELIIEHRSTLILS